MALFEKRREKPEAEPQLKPGSGAGLIRMQYKRERAERLAREREEERLAQEALRRSETQQSDDQPSLAPGRYGVRPKRRKILGLF